eukprot:g29222.t1
MRYISASFEYLFQLATSDRKVGRVLARWSKEGARGGEAVLLTDLDQCNERNLLEILLAVCDDVFGFHAQKLDPVFKQACFAALLRTEEEFLRKAPNAHALVFEAVR